MYVYRGIRGRKTGLRSVPVVFQRVSTCFELRRVLEKGREEGQVFVSCLFRVSSCFELRRVLEKRREEGQVFVVVFVVIRTLLLVS
jgi:hypothetical protein